MGRTLFLRFLPSVVQMLEPYYSYVCFSTNIKDDIIAKSFRTDVSTVQKIKASLIPKGLDNERTFSYLDFRP